METITQSTGLVFYAAIRLSDRGKELIARPLVDVPSFAEESFSAGNGLF